MVKENEINNIVWFGSYGKTIVAKEQEIIISTHNPVLISGTVIGQSFELSIRTTTGSNIYFFNSNNVLIYSFSTPTTAEPTDYLFSGVLTEPLATVMIDEYTSFPTLYLKEVSKAKKLYSGEGQGNRQSESNFSSGIQALADTLTQKLSVMKGELWHNISFGLPLLEKVKSKALIDSALVQIVLKQKEVISILKFVSNIINREYHCEIEIQTSLGSISISI